MITRERNIILQSRYQRPYLADVYYRADGEAKPVVVFSHGFKGFKDWGAFDLVADAFADAGFVFVKFNFSHNGTTVDHPMDFADLEAFGDNNISIELADLGGVLDWITSSEFVLPAAEVNSNQIFLLGHSRGGGISILKAREDKRVKKLCTWASINEFGRFWTKETMEQLKKDGVIFISNARTHQMMPVKWQMYEDYFHHRDRLYIPDAVKELTVPFLIVHGSSDETVPVAYAKEMKGWNNRAGLLLVPNANHSFGARHPWLSESLPADLEKVVCETLSFFAAKETDQMIAEDSD